MTLTRRINIISRCSASYRAKYSPGNLPGIYHCYAFAVCTHPGWSQDRLAKHLCISKSSVARHCVFLEEQGYITRETGEKDKRELLIYPTQKMLDILPYLTAISREWNARLTAGLDEQELQRFIETLEKLTDRAREILYDAEAENENGN